MSSQYRIELAIFKLTWPDDFSYKVNKTFISFNAWSCRHWFIGILFSSLKLRKFFNFYVCLTEMEVFTWSFRRIRSRPHTEMSFLQWVQVVDSQCCGLWNLTITELDSILCLLYRSSFVRQNFRPFHIMLKLTRSLYEFISYRRMWIQLYLLTLAVWFCEHIMFLPVIAK